MDEQVLQDLYARAQSLGYKKGIEDFRTLIQTDPSVQDDNFAYVQSRGYKKTKEDFLGLLGMNQSTSTIPLKKKESPQSTESLSGDGSLGQSLPEITKRTLNKYGIEPQPQWKPKEDPLRFNQMPPQMQVEEAFKIIQGKGYQGTKEDFIAEYGIQVPQTQEEEYRNKDIFAQNIRNAYSSALRYSPQKKEVVAPAKVEPTLMEQTKEQFAEQFPKTIERIKKAPEEAEQIGEYLETVKKGEREAELAQIQTNQQDEEFLRLVSGVDNLYIKGASEERAERELNERFKKYGIVFAQSKAGRDVLIARTADGKKSIEVPLAASTSDYNSKRLRDFIIQNGKAQTESMSEDFITKSLRAQNMRRVGRLNKDGSASTVEFMSFEQDGKFLVAPTLFPKDNLNYGADPRGWMKLEPEKAIEEARKRGEIFEFKTKAEAERFAEGAWKDVTMSDLEGQKFFQERGLDYFDYKNRRDEMLSIDKEQALIENVSGAIKRGEITNAKQYFAKKLSPEEAIKYSYLLNGNNLRPDLESYVQKRQQQKNELYTQVEDRTFFNDGKVQTTFEDFDVYLNKKSEESKKKAEETNKIAKQKYQELNAISMEAFGVPAAQLMTYKPKTQDEVNVINDIKQRMSAVVDLQKVAAERYYASSTFFDSKLNKAARNEYDENMAAWWSEFNSAWARGEAGAHLMKTIMGVNSVEEAGQLISEAMQDTEGGSRSRAFQTYMSAGSLFEGDERATRAFWSDPIEILTTLAATSFAQLLPIGFRIVPATTLSGAGIGAGISAASTGGLGTIGGAVSGGKYGFQTGMEMANFAMEYTNSFFEAAQERGYDVKDPEQFVKAYADDAVWNETNNIGIRRGLAIGGVGLMSSSLAGKVFKVSKLASKAQKVGSFVAERAVFDPLMEGAGELLAQEWSTGTYDLKEIEGEMMGGIGNNAISAGFNIATSALKNTNIDYANTLTDISAVAEESASDERISNWAANMRRLGQIDAETEQRIQRNVGLRRESKDLLSVGDNGKIASKDSKLQARMMELMAARDEMSSTNNRREVYRNYIAQVNEELREIAETKKLRAPENAVNLSAMNAPTSAPGIPKYSINGRSMTKANFMDAVGKMSKSRYMRSRIVVDNDEATTGELNQKLIDKGFITKPKTDAIQEQSTAQVSPQVSAAVGEGVGEQVPGQEEVAGEVEQERLLEETQQQVEQSRGRLSELEAAIPAAMEVTPEVLVQATNNELAPEQLDGVLSSIADDIISETELSPEQDALVSANKARVDELVSLKSEQEALSSEVSDLETILSQSGGFQFRAEEGVTTTRDADWDSKTKAELPASSFESDEAFQSTIRDGQWGMLTAENPDTIQVSDAENEAANKRAEEWLRSRGYNPQRIFGKYGNSENSFFVEGLTTEDAVEFAREFSQENVATDKGLVYQDGKMNARQKGQETFAPADNFYSTIKIGDKLSDFSVSYEDEKTESGVKPAQKTEKPLSTFDQQDQGAEIIVGKEKDRWGRSQVWRERIENAGDILREISSRGNKPDVKYLREKIEKIKNWLSKDEGFYPLPKGIETLEDVEKSNVRFSAAVDGLDYLKKFHNDVLQETIDAYKSIVVQTKEEKVVKDFILSLLTKDKKNIESALTSVENIVDDIQKKGELISTPIETPKTGPQFRAGENPLQDVESTTKAFEGVDEKSIGELPFLFNHSTQMFDNDGNKIEFKDFEEGHRIFRVGETKVQPIWFSKKPYAEGNEIRQIKTIINTSNPFDFRNKTQRNNLESFAVSKYGEKYKGISELIENGDWESLELDYDGAIPALIKEAGHDSYFSKEGGQVTIAVFNPKQIKIATPQSISQAYHKAKADGSNPELVKAVEDLLGAPKAGPQTRIDTKRGKKIGKFDALEGAPKTKGLVGPDPNLVAVAEEYAKKNGIPFVRQGEYVQANEKRGKRIALAFDRMKHDPSNPKVKEAYADLIRQTRMQYEALVDAGYEFTFFDSNSDPYQGNPSNAMRDLRENKKMAVYGTYDGYGTQGITATDQAENPLLEDTGLKWKDQNGVEHPVTANDLFRAVHDAFGHGLEGAGFRARGEENAWQAHVRLFTGPAIGAMTSETRGQNSWLNFGPYGEQNKKASVFETVFAEQKIGLMPEWTWTEGRAMDMPSEETSVTEEVQEINEDAEVERIVSEMNELESPLVDTSAQIESTEGASIDVQELNSRLDTPLDVVNIQILDGVPVLVTISDQLVASNDGVVDSVTDKNITNLFGGLGFNGIKKFLKAAWANVNEDDAKKQHKKATEIYENNKAIIEKFWADNPKYDGHVPMLVVKMGENSILSNEAVSRVLVERIKSLNLSEDTKKEAFSNLQKRLNKFVENYKKEKAAVDRKNSKLKEGEKKKAINASTKNPYNLAKFISENNIKDFDGVLNSIAQMPISARGVINKLLTSGSIRKPGKLSKKPGGPGKDSIAKILLGDNKNNSLLSIQSITDVLTEPSTSNVPIGSVISVVGVKVAEKQADGTYKAAGGPIAVGHPNYEYGAEGMSFGVVKNPMTLQSIMPAAYDAVVSKNIEKVKEKKKPIGTSTAIGIGQGLKGLVGRTISTNPPKMMALISLINKAFPNVAVYTTPEAFNRILQNTDTKLTMKGDAVLYGVTANGDIYINPEVHNTESDLFNTIIHEFGHVWLNMLLTSPLGSKGRKLYEQGVNIIREGIKTDPKLKALYDNQMKLFNNNEADAINEMLAILIGNRGELISKASIRTKFNDFLLAMWEYVRSTFKMSKDISVEEISNMSLDDFLGTAMADLLSGEAMKISDAQLTKMRNLTSMARQDDSMQSIIDLGRQNGFSDQSIKEILMRRGFKAADIDTAMEVRVDLMTELPDAFTNVEGGVKEGMKLFADVRQQLSKYAKKKVKEADGTTRTRTMSEIRQKALELLKEHPIFKAQATITKDELILAFDRSMSTRANRGVDAQIAEIRKGLKSKKMGVKELAAAQKKLINFVSSVLPQSKGYSTARIERIVRLIGSTNINNFDAQAERVIKIVEAQKDLMAKKDIADAVARQRQEMRDRRAGQKELRYFQITLKNFIRTNLPKSKGYSQLMVNRLVAAVANTTTQNYVAQAVKVLNIVEKQRKLMSNQRIREIANVIVKSSKIDKTGSNKRRAGRVDADTQALFATMKQTMRALAMAQKGDSSMLDRISASVDPAILAGKGIDLDEVQQKIDNGEELTAAERDAFNTTVALQELGGIFSMSLEELDSLLERTKEMATEGIARLKADKLVLSAEISSMKTQAEAQIKSDFGFLYDENGDLKTKNRLDSEFRQIWENFRKLKVWDGIKGWVQTIDFQSLTGFQDFMRKKIYHIGTLLNVLDKGGDFFKKNVYDVLNRMDEKSKRGFQMEMANLDSFARSFGFKNYKQFARSLNGPPANVNGKLLTIDQMMRVYALSKNPIQRNKLIDMGIDIDRVESLLTDEQRGFADMVVDYLSNSYFDGVNSIYSYVNNVNLGYVENYFPTKTIQTKIDGNILESGDFGSVFNAETAPALKERTDTKGEIDLSSDFTAVLENHFRSMERYKAMAIGVRKMVQIFKMEDVKTLLERTGTKDMIMRGLNFAINPDSMTREPTTIVGKLSSKFTGFALSFKAIQILKQGSSFVQAFEDYTVRKGKPTPVLDHIMFMLDMAYIVATLPKQIKKAYDMSANVKERLDQGLEGDVYGLESGTGVFRPISKSSSAWAKARRAFQTGAAAPTVLGDIIGVLGYMAVYNRMIKQGFTHAEALEAFNNYNSTQQSRRATEKSPIQMSNNEFQRLFTMFGSTVFLQMNKIAQTSTNIMRSAKKGKMPKAKDVRGLMLNLAISNVLFVGAANIAKFIYGDDEDEEEALKAMRNAMLGLNVIYAIPIFGSALESMVAYAEGEPDRADDTINVFQNLFRKYKKAEEGLDDGNVWAAVQPLVEIVIGAQLDPFIGIYNYFGGDEDMQEDAAYDMLGITQSYRPSNDEKPVSTMGKEDMKRYFPDLYDEVYGPNSPGYDIQQEINEMEKEIEKEQQKLKDEAYGYSE